MSAFRIVGKGKGKQQLPPPVAVPKEAPAAAASPAAAAKAGPAAQRAASPSPAGVDELRTSVRDMSCNGRALHDDLLRCRQRRQASSSGSAETCGRARGACVWRRANAGGEPPTPAA